MESVTFPWTGIRLKIILAMKSRLNAYWAKNLRSLRMLESRSTPVGMAADSLNHTESVDDIGHPFYSGKIHGFPKMFLHNREDLVNFDRVLGFNTITWNLNA